MTYEGCIVLEIEEFVSSAFINSIKKKGNRILKFSKIEEYACKVIDNLNEKGIKARLNFSKELDDYFFERYSDWFQRMEIDNEIYVVLEKDITSMDLFSKFLAFISVEVVLFLEEPNNTKVLLE